MRDFNNPESRCGLSYELTVRLDPRIGKSERAPELRRRAAHIEPLVNAPDRKKID